MGTHDYIKTDMTSSDFDQAIVAGWEIVLQSPDGKVLLRKPKSSDPIIFDDSKTPVGA
jgi:hypothetical protein